MLVIEADIIKKDRGALICRFDDQYNLKGFLSTTSEEYNLSNEIYQTIEDNSVVRCSIIGYDLQHNSYQLKFIEIVELDEITAAPEDTAVNNQI